ncbi:MAG: glycerate kinase [Rhodospirillaceae bacterium]|mgnify:CR=1 FL=1|nr:glycerate kinase [Rhodospirillaceae bacterium]
MPDSAAQNPSEFLKAIFDSAVTAADPKTCLPPHLKKALTKPAKGRTVVLGGGKAGGSMAKAVEDFWLENHPTRSLEGLVVTRYGHAANCDHIEIVEAGHPIPDATGSQAAQRILSLAKGLNSDDIAVCLISGGSSALLSLPASSIRLRDKRVLTEKLLKSGATIQEMNCIRKHLSSIKGGRLAQAASPAQVLTFCISDVPGDDLDVIGSGPTVADPTFYNDAIRILEKYKINKPSTIMEHLKQGKDETPKPGDILFDSCQTSLIATPQLALEAAARSATAKGITPMILGDAIEGEAREVALVHAGIVNQIVRHNQPIQTPVVLLSGGETTVTVRGSGRGGRNSEFLLALAINFGQRSSQYLHRIAAISGDTDGLDGTEDNAGALYLPDTLHRAGVKGINLRQALENNDAYNVFKELGDLFFTGPTLTNVNDFRAILIT